MPRKTAFRKSAKYASAKCQFIEFRCKKIMYTDEAEIRTIMRRDKLKIILDILNICNNGANKTKIVYQANLNFKMANIYIDILTNEGLLDPQDGSSGKVYLTTLRGKEMLKDVRQIYDRLDQYSMEDNKK